MARSSTAKLMALAGTMALVAIMVVAPRAEASAVFGAEAAANFGPSVAESAPVDAGAGASRRLLQPACATTCKGQIKQPVCGTDKKSYDNFCLATCAKATVAYFGACKSKPCLCPPVWAPVCAGGKTYVSACFAKCAGAGSTKDGFCGASCSCGSIKNPVCALDGKTYDNVCKAYCGGTVPYYSGTCDKRIGDCACPTVNDPVCVKAVQVTEVPGLGTIRTPYNVTYSSPCLAKCQGKATTWTKGACGDYPVYESSSYTCGCSFEIKPVCAQLPILNISMTLYNKCAAQCVGYKVLYDGVCKGECICPTGAGDVCVDGKKPYKSACQARCAGAKTWTDGKCKQCLSCPTPMSLNDYACGSDGIQYMSACAAECAGVKVAYKGLCKGLGGK